jgi:phage-related protein
VAFENLGIGGVLRFESRAAVANMGAAERAFKGVETRANQLSTSMARIGSGLQRLNVGGNVLALASGISFAGLIREGIQFNKEMETAKLAIATVMAATTKTPLEQNIENAAVAMDRLNVISAQTPGEIGDLVNIYQLMAGPITKAGGEMEDILELSKGTAIMAGVLKRSFQDTGAAMAKLQAGTVESGNDIIIMLKSMGLLTETTEEWRELLPEQRLKRIHQIMATFAESGERVGQTFDAQSSTIKSLGKIILGAFTERLFHRMTETLGRMAKAFYDNEKAVLATARAWGDKFGAVIEFVGEAVVQTGQFIADMFSLGRHWAQKFDDQLGWLGLTLDMQVIGKLTFIATTFVALSAAASPFLSIIGLIGGKVMALGSIVSGLAGVIGAVAGPLAIVAAIAGGLFLVFRKEGESIGDTLARGFAYAQETAMRFWEAIRPIIPFLQQAFANIRDTAAKFWEGIQPGLAIFRNMVERIVTLLINTVAQLAPILGQIIVRITEIFEAVRPGLEVLFNAWMKIQSAILGVVEVILPKVIEILGPIVDAMMRMAARLGAIFSKVMIILQPVIDALLFLFNEVLMPIVSFLLDILAPAFTMTFDIIMIPLNATIWLFEKLLDLIIFLGGVFKSVGEFAYEWFLKPLIDGLTWIVEQVEGPVTAAWNALGEVFQAIGDIINKYVIEPLKTVFGWIGKVIGGISDLIGGIGDFLGITGETAQTADLETVSAILDEGMSEVASMDSGIDHDMDLAQVKQAIGDAKIDNKQPDINVKNDVNIKSNLCIDGRSMSAAQARHQIETQERAGFNNTPWQNRRVQISGTGGNR